jgi:hypothetical protein
MPLPLGWAAGTTRSLSTSSCAGGRSPAAVGCVPGRGRRILAARYRRIWPGRAATPRAARCYAFSCPVALVPQPQLLDRLGWQCWARGPGGGYLGFLGGEVAIQAGGRLGRARVKFVACLPVHAAVAGRPRIGLCPDPRRQARNCGLVSHGVACARDAGWPWGRVRPPQRPGRPPRPVPVGRPPAPCPSNAAGPVR